MGLLLTRFANPRAADHSDAYTRRTGAFVPHCDLFWGLYKSGTIKTFFLIIEILSVIYLSARKVIGLIKYGKYIMEIQ